MASYSFRFLAGGKPVYTAEHYCADDLDALDEAEFFAKDFEVEIWQGTRLVARVKRSNTPATVSDRASG